jgi:spore maturation protein CgeB
MISSWPPIVDYFRSRGGPAEGLKLGFDERILAWLPSSAPTTHDVAFIGGLAPSHRDRVAFLERLLREVNVEVFGYGWEQLPPHSPIRRRWHGPVWGRRMYETLRGTRLTLNRHAWIEVDGKVATHLATNMRLYEATGVGTCLVTEGKENLSELFDPGREVVAYEDEEDCLEKIRRLLSYEAERAAIARAGQRRTLREHTYQQRMPELLDILRRRLRTTR